MATVRFLPSDVVAEASDGESLFEVARRSGIPVETACVGKATCGLCRVKVVAGEAYLSGFNRDEERHLGNVYFLTKVRLACQARIAGGDVTVELAPKKRPAPR